MRATFHNVFLLHSIVPNNTERLPKINPYWKVFNNYFLGHSHRVEFTQDTYSLNVRRIVEA